MAVKITTQTLLITMLAIGIFAYFTLYEPTEGSILGSGTTSTSGTQYSIGFTFSDDHSISGGAVTTTSPTYSVYNSNGRTLGSIPENEGLYGEQGNSIAAGTSTTNVVVYPTDGNVLFVNVDTGTTDFVDPAKFLQNNPAFSSCRWLPVSNKNIPELVCELQISSLGSPNYDVSPSLTSHLKVPVLPDDLGVTLDSPADQTGVGVTSATDLYITWTASALAANQGWGLAKIWITSNQTSMDFTSLDLTIDSSGSMTRMDTFIDENGDLYISQAAAVSGTSSGIDQTWRYYPSDESVSSDYTNTLLIGRGSGDQDALKFTLHLQSYFDTSGHGSTVVFNVQVISANNALQSSVSDSVTIAA